MNLLSRLAKISSNFTNRKTLYLSLVVSSFCVIFGFLLFHGYYVNLYFKWPTLDDEFWNLGFQFFNFFNFFIDFILFVGFVYICLESKIAYKITLLFIFFLSFFIEAGYYEFYERFSIPNDIIMAFTATDEQRTGLISAYLNLNILYLIFGYLLIELFFNRKKGTLGLKSFMIVLISLIAHAVILYYTCNYLSQKHPDIKADNINKNMFLPLPTAMNTLFNSGVGYMLMKSAKTDDKRIKINYQSVIPPTNNIILIVDESLRGDHLSINGYTRNTTPFLEILKAQNILQNLGIISSGSTASLTSNNLLIIGENISNGKDIIKHSISNPTVFQYAKAMNYKTYFFDPQKNAPWSGIEDDNHYIDKRLNNKTLTADINRYDVDFKIAKTVNQIINKSTGNFIYIFKRGCHFPYENNYPKSAQIWKPVFEGKKVMNAKQDELVNSYDNSMHYNLNKFFKLLVGDYKTSLKNTTIIYVGDHGESLLEDGKSFGHGGKSKYQAMVPLFLIGLNIKINERYKASHANILPTVLDLMKYPSTQIKFPYSISLLKASEKDNLPRKYILPNLATPEIFEFDLH